MTGWKKLDFGRRFFNSCRAGDGVLIVAFDQPDKSVQFWEQTPAGSETPFRVVMETGLAPWNASSLDSTFDGKEVYAIQDRNLFRPRIQRYERGELNDVNLPISTPITKWLHWTERVLMQIVGVVFVVTILLICSSIWLSRGQDSSYQFGHDTVQLATFGRRCLARAIDLILLFSPLLVRALAAALHLDFTRVQFTPDLMPGDITGSLVYDARTAEFVFRTGPVFTNLMLADEINRTPPKTLLGIG